jgi:hypothetical protein
MKPGQHLPRKTTLNTASGRYRPSSLSSRLVSMIAIEIDPDPVFGAAG